MRTFFPLLAMASAARALFFYIDNSAPKCFTEDLAKDTMVVGHYEAQEWDDGKKAWETHDAVSIFISVDETFDNDHRIVSQRGSSSGRFAFSSHNSGNHKICFKASSSSGRTGWLSVSNPNGGIKLVLDLLIGESTEIPSADREKLDDLSSRVKDLNTRLVDIKREQVFQREREAEFRDQSESTNSRVVRWILIQLTILAAMCAWQLSHLRSFFIKQKLT